GGGMTLRRGAFALLAIVAWFTWDTGAAVGQWSGIGPQGGRAFDVVNDPVSPTTSFASTAAGLFKTTDGATTWQLIGSGLFLRMPAIAASNPSVLYAVGGDVSLPDLNGVYKSTDGGVTWTLVFPTGILSPESVISLAVDPTDPSIAYAGTENNGLFKTTDGGVTWNESDTGITDTVGIGGPRVSQIVVDPQTPSTVFALTCCNGAGIFKSTDAGASWAPSNAGLSAPNSAVLALDPQTPSTLYALTSTLQKSVDGGASWTPAGVGLPEGLARALAIDPQSPSVIYAGIIDGFGATGGPFHSMGRGATVAASGCASLGVASVAVRADGGILLAAENLFVYPRHGGVYASTDGAATCPLASQGITAFQAVSLAAAGTLYLGDYSTGVYRTSDGGATWSNGNAGLPRLGPLLHP